MKHLLIILLAFSFNTTFCQTSEPINQKIFIYGGGPKQEFIKYTAQLTGKKKPKICYIPTASGDNANGIIRWYELCSGLEIEPLVLRVWIASPEQKESWEEIITGMDAIIVGGGNTLNMIAIWKAQGIDLALKKAYDKGVILAGGSAGSLCWFEGGTTDSRPKELTIVECLGFLKYSHSPHYNSESTRRPLYQENILKSKLGDGYACDDKSGILFVNGKAVKSVSLNHENNSYYVFEKDGKIIEETLESEIIK